MMLTNTFTLCNAILMAMVMRQYATKHIDQCVVHRASTEVLGRRNWSSIHPYHPSNCHGPGNCHGKIYSFWVPTTRTYLPKSTSPSFFVPAGMQIGVNSLTAMGCHDGLFFNKLCVCVISPRIFGRS